ncbi:MAG: DUF460 domain-containing protein [Sulfolobales archaeon]
MGGDSIVSMGIDLYRGSPASRLRATYAVCIVRGGEVIYEATDLPLPKVIRLALEYKPNYIVIDNLYELARSKRELLKVLSLFPYGSQILLATFSDAEGFKDLRDIAAEHGLLESRRKQDPQSTARILAMLGQRGVGHPIRVWEERTKVIVSKGRSGRAGGSSEDRYLRGLRTAVLRYVRRIKDALDSAKIPYQLSYRKAEGGLDRAVFIIDAPKDKLAGIVRSKRGRYVTVRVRPIARTRIVISENIERRMRPVIAGVDPGSEYGVAVIDLDGRVIATETIKGGDVLQAISSILRYGTPVLVASDKKPVPEAVRRVAAAFNAKLYEPDYVVSDQEKSSLVASSGYQVGSVHERDALAACLLAYKSYAKKFEQVERILESLEIKIPVSRVKAEVIKGSSIASAIEAAIEDVIGSLEEDLYRDTSIIQKLVREAIEDEGKIRNLERRISELLSERQALLDRIRRLEEELRRISSEYEAFRRSVRVEVERERAVASLIDRLRSCQDSYRSLEEALGELRRSLEDLRRIILEYDERGYRKIQRIYAPIDEEDLEDIVKKGPIDGIYILYTEDPESLKRQDIEYIRSRLKRIALIAPRCPFKYTGDRDEHVVCIETPPELVATISNKYVLIDRPALEKIKGYYRELYNAIPKKPGMSEEDLERLIMEYRGSKFSSKG